MTQVVARPTMNFLATSNAVEHTPEQWGQATAKQLVGIDYNSPNKHEAETLRRNIAFVLSQAFITVRPEVVDRLADSVWAKIVKLAKPTPWGHWFETSLIEQQMRDTIRRNLFSAAAARR